MPAERDALGADAHALLHAALAGTDGASVRPFAEQVVRQVARPPGAPADDAAERAVATEVAALLAAVRDGDAAARTDAAGRLAAHAELLAACFQNVDLLYAHESPLADRVSLLVMEAVGRLAAG